MVITRRKALGITASASAVLLTKPITFAQSQPSQITGIPFFVGQDEIIIHPVNHASLVLSVNSKAIYVDPVGDASRYADLPRADLILITHHHPDHFDQALLTEIADEQTPFIVNPVVGSRLPDPLNANATILKNGESTDKFNINFAAIPAYNTTQDRKHFHPKGRDNGYVLSIGDTKVYIAGDTEDTPEMRALTDIDVAFVPMNLPFTMDAKQAASGVNAFAPTHVYPYHYGTTNFFEFKDLVEASDQNITVQLYDWYGQT